MPAMRVCKERFTWRHRRGFVVRGNGSPPFIYISARARMRSDALLAVAKKEGFADALRSESVFSQFCCFLGKQKNLII